MINCDALLHMENSWKHSAGSSMGDNSCRAPANLFSTVKRSASLSLSELQSNKEIREMILNILRAVPYLNMLAMGVRIELGHRMVQRLRTVLSLNSGPAMAMSFIISRGLATSASNVSGSKSFQAIHLASPARMSSTQCSRIQFRSSDENVCRS